MMAANWVSFLALKPTLPGLMRYFAKRLGAGWMIGQQLVADIVEIANQRDVETQPFQAFAHFRHGSGAFVAVHGDADDLGPCLMQRGHLLDRRVDVGGVRVRHGLHDDGRTTADHARRPHRHRRFCGGAGRQ